MSLEGRLRELGLAEVLQLLGLSRKTGVLELQAQLQGRAACVHLLNGALIDACQWNVGDAEPDRTATSGRNAKRVAACVFELLTWRDGDFRFLPDAAVVIGNGVKLSVESLLVEAASSAEAWEQIGDLIPHQRVIPTFVDVEPKSLPLLRLGPQEWEVLTRVDGIRDLPELASALGREVIDVAELVHRLIAAGLLTLRESTAVPARHPTPPVVTAIDGALTSAFASEPSFRVGSTSGVMHAGNSSEPSSSRTAVDPDLWIPNGADHFGAIRTADVEDEDTVFDPLIGAVYASGGPTIASVAPVAAETSLPRGDVGPLTTSENATTLCQHGDEAARRGDLAGALTFWSAALRSDATLVDADRIREAIALAARLHALLHPAAKRA